MKEQTIGTATTPAGPGRGWTVQVEHVSRRYVLGDGSVLPAADDVTVAFDAGSFSAITGPSGSGKSTLLHLIGAIDRPDSGTISVGGRAITSLGRNALADYRAGIGFVFQQFHLLPALSLLDNVLAPLVARRTSFDREARALELLDAVGLAGRASAVPSQLSGGQQQRVAIARALVAYPGLLLADEPTGNLDSHTAVEILDLISTLRAERGTTVIMATHDAAVAARAERVVEVRDGRITSTTSCPASPIV